MKTVTCVRQGCTEINFLRRPSGSTDQLPPPEALENGWVQVGISDWLCPADAAVQLSQAYHAAKLRAAQQGDDHG